jgi:uncharacterized protein (DUF488 family)
LYREANALVRDGYLVEEERSWRLSEDAPRRTADLPAQVRDDAARVVKRFADWPPRAVTDYLYEGFPWFTANSRIRKICDRPVASVAVYTVGYEGWQVDGFLNMLMRRGIQRLIDVRNNPASRRYGFHASTFRRLCAKVEIEYLHFPELGVRPDLRRNLEGLADYETLFARYEGEVLPRETAALNMVADLTREKPSVLMCMEADPQRCHRSRLALAVAEATLLRVCHLGGALVVLSSPKVYQCNDFA